MSERFPLVTNNLAALRAWTPGLGPEYDFHALRTRDYVYWFDDFIGDTLNATYATTVGTGATAAALVSNGRTGRVELVTGTTDDAQSTLRFPTSALQGDDNPVLSARFMLSAITTVKVEMGFSNDPTTAGAIDSLDAGSAPTLIAGVTDATVAIFDTDAARTNWQFAGADTSTAWRDATLNAAAGAGITHPTPTASTMQWLTVALRRRDLATDDMDAVFFVDGSEEAYRTGGANANTVNLFGYVMVQARAGSASRTLTMDAWELIAMRDTGA